MLAGTLIRSSSEAFILLCFDCQLFEVTLVVFDFPIVQSRVRHVHHLVEAHFDLDTLQDLFYILGRRNVTAHLFRLLRVR